MKLMTLLVCFGLLSACQRADRQRTDRTNVSGEVTLNGQPVPAAEIVFVGQDANRNLKVRGRIEQGQFQLSGLMAPPRGKNRVLIFPLAMELEEFEMRRGPRRDPRVHPEVFTIPQQYQDRSNLVAEVSPSELENYFRFELKSK